MVLLTNDSRGIDRLRFQREVGFLLHCLQQPNRDVRLSRTLRDALAARAEAILDVIEQRQASMPIREVVGEQPSLDTVPALRPRAEPDVESLVGDAVAVALDEALKLFERNDQITVQESDDLTVYAVPEEARVGLNYYRNSILHHFVPEGLLAAAIGCFTDPQMPLDELMKETLFLSRMFKYEWIYEERAEFENVFMRSLRYFEACGWIERTGDTITVQTPRPAELEFFRRNVLSYLEGYALVARNLELMSEEVARGDVVRELLKQARADYLRGDLLYHESLSKPTYENALRLFADWGVLQRRYDASKKRELLKIEPAWTDVEKRRELVEHIEGFVSQ
jgi:glycerol-3-phosphate O-acyltransferase